MADVEHAATLFFLLTNFAYRRVRSPSASSRARMSEASERVPHSDCSHSRSLIGAPFSSDRHRHSPTMPLFSSSRSATIRVELTLRRYVELQLWIKKSTSLRVKLPFATKYCDTTHKSVSSAGWAVLIGRADSGGLTAATERNFGTPCKTRMSEAPKPKGESQDRRRESFC